MSNSDLTIADLWGIQNVASQMDDDKGTNLILVNTVKGEKYLDSSKTIYTEVEVTEALRDNPAWHDSVGPHSKREQFFKQLEKSNH